MASSLLELSKRDALVAHDVMFDANNSAFVVTLFIAYVTFVVAFVADARDVTSADKMAAVPLATNLLISRDEIE